jgi:Arc/MetJ-type ribon-helix-helix transcriptional regulator
VTVVPIRLSKEDAKKLDLLVKLGIYANRTQAIRAIIHSQADSQIANHMLSENVLRALNKLIEQERVTGHNPIRIDTSKTAAEIVAEGRE